MHTKVNILLLNDSDCELDRKVVRLPDGDANHDQILNHALRTAVQDWTLYVGDTIKIVEA